MDYWATPEATQKLLVFLGCSTADEMFKRLHIDAVVTIGGRYVTIRPILPAMIEAGIDILNPIQWRCKGMDRAELKQSFGSRLVFHGGVDNQYTLAMGTVEEVRKEVEDNFRLPGDGGGYIPAPCHNIQAVSPPENIVAMYETAYELGRGGKCALRPNT